MLKVSQMKIIQICIEELDLNRDQSYFLFNTTKEQLNFLRFPLGNLT